MGGESPNWNSNPEQNPEQNQEQTHEEYQNRGAGVLSEISFADAKREGEVPEGVRDEQDYKEYLAEQEARAKEYEKFDNEIFEGIMSIEDPNDRDLATAILPYYYDFDLNNARGQNDNEYKGGLAKGRAIGIKAIVDYMHSDKKTTLENMLFELGKSYFDRGDYEVANNINPLRGWEFKGLDDLIIGQRLNQLDLPEARFLYGGHSAEFQTTQEGKTGRYFFANLELNDNDKNNTSKIITLTLANDIAKRLHKTENYKDSINDRVKLAILQDVYWMGGDGKYTAEEINKQIEKKTNDVFHYAKEIMENDSYDPKESSLPFEKTGLIGLVCAKELSSEFEDYQLDNRLFKTALKTGKNILRGKNWKDRIYLDKD